MDVAGECLQEAIDICTSFGVIGFLTCAALVVILIAFLLVAVCDGMEFPRRKRRPPPMTPGR